MSILSITFHTVDSQLTSWQEYLEAELEPKLPFFRGVKQFVLSEVESEMLTEGTNTNLLLFFGNSELREEFSIEELPALEEEILGAFGDAVMVFKTHLNIKKSSD